MARVSTIQSNFNGGEISPKLYGRTDLEAYQKSLRTCLNAIPQVQGGWTRRPGTRFVAEVKDSTKACRARRFEFSVTQAYVIEFGDQVARFYRDKSPILEATKTITAITKANPGVVTSAGHGYSNGDHVELAAIVGMTELNGRRVKVANVAANTFELQDLAGTNIDTSGYTTYTSGGTAARVYTIATPYVEADLFQLKFVQSADVLWITHRSYAPRKLTRTAHTSWTLSTPAYDKGPFLPDTNTLGVTMTPSATTGAGITITASTTNFNNDQGFLTTDVGRLIRILHSSTWGWARITARASTTSVTATVISDFGATTASSNWRLGAFSDTTGYPACATFHEGRLCYAGARGSSGVDYPDLIHMSRNFRFEDFQPTDVDGSVDDDHAITVSLISSDVAAVRWMESDEKGLLVGAVNGEFVIRRATTGEALTPATAKASQATDNGSADVQAIRAGKAVIMLDRTKSRMHEIAYVYTDDGFRAPEMSVLAEHIAKGGLVELAYQKHPEPVIWAPRADGVLVGFTYNREQQVLGWHRHELGGYSNAGHTAHALVESVTCIPSTDATTFELWMVVKRYINGRTVRYIEVMEEPHETGDAQEDAFYVDSGGTYDGASTTTVSALWHLVGETVAVLADGAARPNETVSALGKITLEDAASVVQVGYAYNSDFQTLRNNAGSQNGTAQFKSQRKHRVGVRLHETGDLSIGPDFDNLDEIIFRTSEDATNTAVPLFNGDKSQAFEDGYSSESLICARASKPLPATILAVGPDQATADR